MDPEVVGAFLLKFMHPKWRIVVSVVSGVCCVLVLGLWALSFSRPTTIARHVDNSRDAPNQHELMKVSNTQGMLRAFWYATPTAPVSEATNADGQRSFSRAIIKWRSSDAGFEVHASHLFLAIVLGAICALPWASRFQNSRRTVLGYAAVISLAVCLIGYDFWASGPW